MHMNPLRQYLNGLPVSDQQAFAQRCKTTLGYLRKAISIEQPIGESIVIAIERESDGQIRCEDLRPDVDWAFLRGTTKPRKSVATSA